MKNFSLIITSFLLISSLEARENPFVPSKAYLDEVARLMEIDENYPKEFQENQQNIETEDMTPVLKESDINKPHENAVAKTEEEIKKAQMEKEAAEAKEKALNDALANAEKAKKESEKLKALKEAAEAKAKALEEQGPVIYVKKRDDITVNNSLDILPFLNIQYTNDEMTLTSMYKVFKKFYLEDENKLIIDFKGEVKFFTKRVDLESKQFKKVIVGNHETEKYFRVVLVLEESPLNYDVTYNENSVYVNFNKEIVQ